MQITLQQKGRGLIHSTILNGTELELGRISQSVSHHTFQLYMRDLKRYVERLQGFTDVVEPKVAPYSVEDRSVSGTATPHVRSTTTVITNEAFPLPSPTLTERYSQHVMASGQLRMLGTGTHGGYLVLRYYLPKAKGGYSTHQMQFTHRVNLKSAMAAIIDKLILAHNAVDDTELRTYLTEYGQYLAGKLKENKVVDNNKGDGTVRELKGRQYTYTDLFHKGELLVAVCPVNTVNSTARCRIRFFRYGAQVNILVYNAATLSKRIEEFIQRVIHRLDLTLTTQQYETVVSLIARKVLQYTSE